MTRAGMLYRAVHGSWKLDLHLRRSALWALCMDVHARTTTWGANRGDARREVDPKRRKRIDRAPYGL
eukprot:285247-Rhodomonas_salina.2